jgi:hypothetical protein
MMRIPVQSLADHCRSVVKVVFAAVMDFALLGVFRSNLLEPVALREYRPIYSRSGRRNRVRY